MSLQLIYRSVARRSLTGCMNHHAAADGRRLLLCIFSCLYLFGCPGNRAAAFICAAGNVACGAGNEGGICYG